MRAVRPGRGAGRRGGFGDRRHAQPRPGRCRHVSLGHAPTPAERRAGGNRPRRRGRRVAPARRRLRRRPVAGLPGAQPGPPPATPGRAPARLRRARPWRAAPGLLSSHAGAPAQPGARAAVGRQAGADLRPRSLALARGQLRRGGLQPGAGTCARPPPLHDADVPGAASRRCLGARVSEPALLDRAPPAHAACAPHRLAAGQRALHRVGQPPWLRPP